MRLSDRGANRVTCFSQRADIFPQADTRASAVLSVSFVSGSLTYPGVGFLLQRRERTDDMRFMCVAVKKLPHSSETETERGGYE